MKHCHTQYSQTPLAFKGERADCAVRSIMVAAGCSYETAWAALAQTGRTVGRRVAPSQIRAALPKVIPCPVQFPPIEITDNRGRTLAQFIAARPAGRYVVFVRGHFVAIRDGVVHDWKWNAKLGSARRRIVNAWQIV